MGNDIFDTISNKSVFTFLSEFDSVWTGKTIKLLVIRQNLTRYGQVRQSNY
jgi:hypothetical protein